MDQEPLNLSQNYLRIEKVLNYLLEHAQNQPDLAQLAQQAGLSEFHFQRLFQQWVGISPKRFLQFLSLEAAKKSLAQSASLLDASLDAGLSGPGRLHDLFVTYEALTPGEYKRRGAGLNIDYGFHPSPFGECLVLITERGLCGLQFVTDTRQNCLTAAKKQWPQAVFIEDTAKTAHYPGVLFTKPTTRQKHNAGLRVFVRGSAFQIKVWQALLDIPAGHLVSYGQLAKKLGYPCGGQISRAIGHANAQNLIAWLIPCHRVIRQTGALGGYRWGLGRKLAMIGWEAAQQQPHR